MLPDLLMLENGQLLGDAHTWRRRRTELLDAILQIEYGPLPPSMPGRGQGLHSHRMEGPAGARHAVYRISIGESSEVQFALDLLVPAGDEPFPVVLNGDACWRSMTEDIANEVLRRGNILATFNRTEIAADNGRIDTENGLSRLFPGWEFAALSAWAWGYHRCVDFLTTLPFVDPDRIAISGHSRGGKAALLAGATDERIALTNANASGCGGAGPYRVPSPKSETLADILRNFPYWFSPNLLAYVGQEDSLPFDQHALAAAVAPRALLFTEARDDLWATPAGVQHTYDGAKPVFELLAAGSKIGIVLRDGSHAHNSEDWTALLDFMDLQFWDNLLQEPGETAATALCEKSRRIT